VNLIRTLPIIAIAVLSFSYGFTSGSYQIFPYKVIREIKDTAFGKRERILQAPSVKPRETIFDIINFKPQLTMVGDSLTEHGLWNEFLDLKVANRGIGGDTTADILGRIDNVIDTNPNLFIIMAGTNDLKLGAAPQEVADNLIEISEILQETGAQVVLQATIECKRLVCENRLDNIRAINYILKAHPQMEGVSFLDFNGALSDDYGLRSEFTTDGIHLNGAGYLAWIDSINQSGTLDQIKTQY
jgi:lysophospholipase L1-like esterase